MDVEWGKKAIVMKYLFKYVTKGSDFSKLYLERIGSKGVPVGSDGQDNHTVIDCGHLDAPASTDMPTSAVGSVMLLLPSATKPPGPSDGKCDIDSQVKRALFTDSLPEHGVGAVQELAPRVEPEEVGLPVVEAPESSPGPSAAPSTDKNSNTRM
nr:uncharacterized protein LOC127331185 [Lolium perenne]XP_051213209.1 uncharacterized protein LOC127331185 [Lolium perenne]